MSTPQYETYPLTMTHPAFRASEPIPVPGSQIHGADGRLVRQDYRGTPQRFPPVTARDEIEEEYYTSQGYERAGKVDPSAWVKAHSGPAPEEYKPQKYPLWRDGKLYMTAQEDPESSDEDRAPVRADGAEPEAAPAQGTQADNMRATLEEMQRTMQAMAEQMAEQKAEAAKHASENAELKAMLEAATAPEPQPENETADETETEAKRGPGRPRKPTAEAS